MRVCNLCAPRPRFSAFSFVLSIVPEHPENARNALAYHLGRPSRRPNATAAHYRVEIAVGGGKFRHQGTDTVFQHRRYRPACNPRRGRNFGYLYPLGPRSKNFLGNSRQYHGLKEGQYIHGKH